MKTKNMRKKALLASMAMLLVAVVALSGATYAWFTSNTTATASGLKFQTNQQSSLLFAAPNQESSYYDVSSNWVGTYTLKTPAATEQDPRDVLTPCSMNVDSTTQSGLTAAIEVKRVGAGTGDEKTSKVLQIGGGGTIYTEQFYVKSTNDTPLYLTNFQMAAENSNLSGALRFAVKVGSNPAKIFAPAAAEANVTRKCVTAGTATFTEDVAPTFNDLYTGANTLPASITVADQTISTWGATSSGLLAEHLSTKQLVTITFWLEGNDQRCNNTAMGQTIDGFTFTFGTGENS